MENSLRGLVLSKFKSISEFARILHWDRKKASRIVNRLQWPSAEEMDEMSNVLGIRDCETFVHIFLPFIPTKWEKEV